MYSGLVIKSIRVFKKKSQREIAEKLGITQQAYSKLEEKEWIDRNLTIRLIQILGCSIEEIEELEKAFRIKK
jgi:transcriptional regulator with XRE-family HTH domain